MKDCNNQLTVLITQYHCKTLNNCMLAHGRPYFRSLDRGHKDCDQKLCCVDDIRPELPFVVTSLVSLDLEDIVHTW